jgi:hypothetical protein
MEKKILKKVLLVGLGLFALSSIVLGVHIYKVTRPKVVDANAIAMARIDFKQDISVNDVAKITNWFMLQKGISQFKCSPESKHAVFTFYPAKMNATAVVETFSKELHFNAVRYMPNKAEMMIGCPVSKN